MCINAVHICQINPSILDGKNRINLDEISEVESVIDDNLSA